MDIFSHYRIEKEDTGYRVNLYIDSNTTEFANEFNHIKDEKFTEFYDTVQDYVDDKFSNIKVDTVRVYLGNIPVAEILHGDKSSRVDGFDKYDASILYHGEHFREGESLWSIAQKFEP